MARSKNSLQSGEPSGRCALRVVWVSDAKSRFNKRLKFRDEEKILTLEINMPVALIIKAGY